MIAVVVPAHNEEAHIGACLQSLAQAALSPLLLGETVLHVVALDACEDGTRDIVRRFGAATVAVWANNVGVARSLGARLAVDAGARWLAFTDADCVVAADWLAAQLALHSDAVCGRVAVRDWGPRGQIIRLPACCAQRNSRGARAGAIFKSDAEASSTDADDLCHIHAANLGVGATAYRRAGGFQPLDGGEDLALVKALQIVGARVAWSLAPRVISNAWHKFHGPDDVAITTPPIDLQHAVARAASEPQRS